MTDLRKSLDDLVSRAASGGERIVLVSRGKVKAAIIGVEDLQRLKQWSAGQNARRDEYAYALAATDRLRERIRRWQEAHGIEPEDTAETLRRLREEYDDEFVVRRE